MYKIRISYATGDSFNTYDEERELDGTWKDISIIEENINRIQEHYEWYESIRSTYRRSSKSKEKPDFVNDEYSLKLKLDNGDEYLIHTFWVGYFETLNEVSCAVELPRWKR